jgi:hypothetical protein
MKELIDRLVKLTQLLDAGEYASASTLLTTAIAALEQNISGSRIALNAPLTTHLQAMLRAQNDSDWVGLSDVLKDKLIPCLSAQGASHV